MEGMYYPSVIDTQDNENGAATYQFQLEIPVHCHLDVNYLPPPVIMIDTYDKALC